MKRLFFHVVVAALTFALGVVGAVMLRPVEDAFLIASDIPIYQSSFSLVASAEVCEIHGAMLQYEYVSRHYLIQHMAFTMTRYEREKFLYPNAHRKVGDWYVAGGEERAAALVCPECRAADEEWVHRRERR